MGSTTRRAPVRSRSPITPRSGSCLQCRAWLPSIGISSRIDVRGSLFEHWRGDLLIGSLRAQTLYRVHRYAGSIVYIERMEVGERVRDILEDPDGRIPLWTDSMRIVSLRPTIEDTVSLLLGRCASCHGGGGARGAAQDLVDVVGRPVAVMPGFHYSDALRAVGGRWTESQLDAFLRSAARFALGNTLAFDGIADDQLRAELITRLRQAGALAGLRPQVRLAGRGFRPLPRPVRRGRRRQHPHFRGPRAVPHRHPLHRARGGGSGGGRHARLRSGRLPVGPDRRVATRPAVGNGHLRADRAHLDRREPVRRTLGIAAVPLARRDRGHLWRGGCWGAAVAFAGARLWPCGGGLHRRRRDPAGGAD